MIEDIYAVQSELENRFLAMQPVIEQTALTLAETNPGLMREFLTQYSVGQAEDVVRRWTELGEFLLTKYNDGYVADEGDERRARLSQEHGSARAIRARPDQFRLGRPKPRECATVLNEDERRTNRSDGLFGPPTARGAGF